MNLYDNIKHYFTNKELPEIKESYQSFDMFGNPSIFKKTSIEFYNHTKWILFGRDNLYPQKLNDLYETSPLHSAIVDFKKLMVCGQGYTIDDSNLNGYEKVALASIKNEIEDETPLQAFIENITLDLIIHSTIYLKLIWDDKKTKLLSVQRMEPSKIRVGVDMREPEKIKAYYYSFNWADTGRFPVKEYHPKSKNIENRVEIMRFIKKSSSALFYTLPNYTAANSWIELDAKIPVFHKSNIENSSNPSKAVFFYQRPANDEAKRDIIAQFQKSFTGEETTGKSMIFFIDGKENAPDIKTIEPNQLDKQFETTAVQGSQNICFAHKINPLIMGLKGDSMGNPKELITAYEIFKYNVINPMRNDIEEIVNKIFQWKGIKAEFVLNDINLFQNLSDAPQAFDDLIKQLKK
jgi:hypothetical protein